MWNVHVVAVWNLDINTRKNDTFLIRCFQNNFHLTTSLNQRIYATVFVVHILYSHAVIIDGHTCVYSHDVKHNTSTLKCTWMKMRCWYRRYHIGTYEMGQLRCFVSNFIVKTILELSEFVLQFGFFYFLSNPSLPRWLIVQIKSEQFRFLKKRTAPKSPQQAPRKFEYS